MLSGGGIRTHDLFVSNSTTWAFVIVGGVALLDTRWSVRW
ncbi:hypothetical protein M2432_001224 [Mycobacterium sp. OTB74]|jgi:hypothetical protein|nr:hypothetical protein [Mycobacterium sp. OTB74]